MPSLNDGIPVRYTRMKAHLQPDMVLMEQVMAFRGDNWGTAIVGGNRLIFGSVLIAN